MKKIIFQLLNVFLPAVIFYIVYSMAGLVPAILLSILYSIANIGLTYKKTKQFSNTQLFGLIGLALSLIGVLFTKNQKLYYIPALVNNCAFLAFSIGFTLRKKSLFHYLIRDFGFKISEQISEKSLLRVNLIWIAFFALKILSKLIGIIYLDFKELYWLVYILGDPMTVVVSLLSYYFINKEKTKPADVTA